MFCFRVSLSVTPGSGWQSSTAVWICANILSLVYKCLVFSSVRSFEWSSFWFSSVQVYFLNFSVSDAGLLHVRSTRSWQFLHVKSNNFNTVKTSVITTTCLLASTTVKQGKITLVSLQRKWMNLHRFTGVNRQTLTAGRSAVKRLIAAESFQKALFLPGQKLKTHPSSSSDSFSLPHTSAQHDRLIEIAQKFRAEELFSVGQLSIGNNRERRTQKENRDDLKTLFKYKYLKWWQKKDQWTAFGALQVKRETWNDDLLSIYDI